MIPKVFRRLLRIVYSVTPPRWKGPLLRSLIYLEYTPSPRLTFKLAQTQEELDGAYRLLHDSYVSSGFMKPDPTGLRVTIYHALPTTSTLVAKWDDRVIGTVSIIRQNPLGLPLQNIFDISHLEKNGGRVVEISSLAIHPDFRGRQSSVLFLLCKFLYDYCLEYFVVDSMAVAVNPKQRDLYKFIMMFDNLQEKTVASYDFVNGAPAIGQYMDLRIAHNRLLKGYFRRPVRKNLFAFMMQTKRFPNFQFPGRTFFKTSDPVLTPQLLDHFFSQRTDLFHKLTAIQKSALRTVYANSPGHLKVLPGESGYEFIARRRGTRFPVHCDGVLARISGEPIGPVQVLEVSESGFRGACAADLRIGERLDAKILVGNHLTAEVEAEVVWICKSGTAGFTLMNPKPAWGSLIRHLEKDLRQELPGSDELVSFPKRRRWD